jgi:hypothetical protein
MVVIAGKDRVVRSAFRSVIVVVLALAVVLGACSNGGSTPPTDTGDAAALSVTRWCDPADVSARAWVGDGAVTDHMDLFADDTDYPSLICSWSIPTTGRELRLVVHGSADVWDATLAAAGGDLAAMPGLELEHTYSPGVLSVHTPGGRTLQVFGFAGSPQGSADDPVGLTAVATSVIDANPE